MLRYLYPLIVLVLVLLFCGCIPQPYPADSAVGPILWVLSAIFLTVVWPVFIGHRLHEPSWRKLADQLHLTYEPYGAKEGEDNKAARIVGTYRGRTLKLDTERVLRMRASTYAMRLALSVRAPADCVMRFHKESKYDIALQKRLDALAPTGNPSFDRRFVVDFDADLIERILASSNLADKLAGIVRRRPTKIALYDGVLRFVERHGTFMGVETNVNHLREVIDVMCDLAEAIEDVVN